MVDLDDVYRAPVRELFANFRQALLAIAPIADRARIHFADQETHRDWERLAQSMFDAFVRSPIEADRTASGAELPLARYDIDLDDYLSASWLASNASSPHEGAVIRFLSQDSAFDMVQVVDIDPASLRAGRRRTLAVGEINPVLYRRSETGAAIVVTQVEAVE
jgi:hypothetical protein